MRVGVIIPVGPGHQELSLRAHASVMRAWAKERGQHNWSGWGHKVRARVARDLHRIRHWQIIEGDYTAAPDIEASWLVDPPYQTPAGRHYPYQPGSFAALGEWTLARKGQVIACEQAGADWLPWTGTLDIKATSGAKRDGTSKEVVYHRSRHPVLFGS